ncbi:MAG: hypothetical protein GTN89_13660 [Acidobacteria bacterium]|nr:hypothetical protein [Acidobacteriota bacterium]NIM60331.1 hypothetical protein [Acidobacteriota bacterium]NIO60332.1 hypothetical protein [Acidobacteriota bacterium]NIQ31387.1 hypothetical protein [Acidobacteriota bacterium]NIQ86613.1 hypothetical protein [Acidobacteriota bacterium]
MRRLFWITVVLILVSVLLNHALAGEADETAAADAGIADLMHDRAPD